MRFSRQVLLLQIGVVVLVLAVGTTLAAVMLRQTLVDQYGRRALDVARTVAVDPVVVAAVSDRRAGGALEDRAQATTLRTEALFVVVTDDHGVRLAHPDSARIGEPVSTPADTALAGGDVVSAVEDGTLGLSVRSKTPVRTPDGRVVGEVSVGYRIDELSDDLVALLTVLGVFAAGALVLGAGASALLNRRLRRVTHGLEPRELTELLYEQEAVLHGIGEGVLAVDADGRVSVRNDEAERLLGTPLPVGARLTDLALSPRLGKAVADGEPVDNLLAVAGDRVLVVNSRTVDLGGRPSGTVLTFRDRTDLDALTRELDGIRALSDGLRAQRHEFSNRLHTLSGLIQLGHHAEAVDYVAALTDAGSADPDAIGDAVTDPYLQALLLARTEQAHEQGTRLTLSDDSHVPTTVTDPLAASTVLGNLLDNALRAARMGPRRPAEVEVTLLAEDDTLHVSVADNGEGVPADVRATLFDEGTTTKLEPGHGLGLALARQAARARGGDVWLGDPGGGGGGALFVARLPGLLDTAREPARGEGALGEGALGEGAAR